MKPQWPMWRRVLAYAILTAAAVGAIALVDRGALSAGDASQSQSPAAGARR